MIGLQPTLNVQFKPLLKTGTACSFEHEIFTTSERRFLFSRSGTWHAFLLQFNFGFLVSSHVHAAYASFLWETEEDEDESDVPKESEVMLMPSHFHGAVASASA